MSDGAAGDVVILGAGVAGLCLARALLDAGGPSSISFWSAAPTPLDERATARDPVTLLSRLPWAPFLRSLLAWIVGGVAAPRR